MTQKKKGFFSRLKGIFSKADPNDSLQMKLSDLGISLLSQQDLQSRLHAQMLVYKYLSKPLDITEPEKFLKILERKVHVLDAAISLTAAPWADPGSSPQKAKYFESWELYNSDALTLINAIRRYYVNDSDTPNPVEYANISTEEILGMLNDVLIKHYFSVGKIVVKKCFFDKHTTARQIAMVQGMMQPKGFMPTTMTIPKQFDTDTQQTQDWGDEKFTSES